MQISGYAQKTESLDRIYIVLNNIPKALNQSLAIVFVCSYATTKKEKASFVHVGVKIIKKLADVYSSW